MGQHTIVILGAAGLLGRALMAACERDGVKYIGYGHDAFDVTEVDDVHQLAQTIDRLCPNRHFDITSVINCAAVTDVARCETDADLQKHAWDVNAFAPAALRNALMRWTPGCRAFVHISTGGVFEGVDFLPHEKHGFDEFSMGRPVTVYSRSKWAGEELLRRTGLPHSVIRVSHLYGPGGTKLGAVLRKHILAQHQQPISLNADRTVSPSYVRLVAECIVRLVVRAWDQLPAILHVAPRDVATWYEFGVHMTRKLGADPERLVRRMSSEEDQTLFRPLYGGIVSRLSGSIGTVNEGLDAYLKDMEEASP